MSKIYHACLSRKSGDSPQKSQDDEESKNLETEELAKTNLKNSEQPQAGLARRAVGGLFSIGAGAVGIGIGSVKWVASTTYSVGSGVLSKVRNTADNSKDKKD